MHLAYAANQGVSGIMYKGVINSPIGYMNGTNPDVDNRSDIPCHEYQILAITCNILNIVSGRLQVASSRVNSAAGSA